MSKLFLMLLFWFWITDMELRPCPCPELKLFNVKIIKPMQYKMILVRIS
jgi:hypothetical protein